MSGAYVRICVLFMIGAAVFAEESAALDNSQQSIQDAHPAPVDPASAHPAHPFTFPGAEKLSNDPIKQKKQVAAAADEAHQIVDKEEASNKVQKETAASLHQPQSEQAKREPGAAEVDIAAVSQAENLNQKVDDAQKKQARKDNEAFQKAQDAATEENAAAIKDAADKWKFVRKNGVQTAVLRTSSQDN